MRLSRMFGRDTDRADPERHKAEQETLELIKAVHHEAQSYRDNGDRGLSLEGEWERGGHRSMGNHWIMPHSNFGLQEGYRVYHFSGGSEDTPTGLHRAVLNRTGTSIISNVADQTQQPLVVRLQAAETRDRPSYWLSPEGGEALHQIMYAPVKQIQQQRQQQIAQAMNDPASAEQINAEAEAAIQEHWAQVGFQVDEDQLIGPNGPSRPLTPQQAGHVRSLIDQQVLSDSDLIAVNDRLVSEVAQQVFDALWEIAGGDRKVVMNEFLCNVFGQQPLRFQWHDDGPRKHTFSLENSHILNVWIDPTHDDISESDYFRYEYLISVDEARTLWPDAAAEIDKASSTGSMGDNKYSRGALWSQTEFQRKMVAVAVTWLRHQQVPMTVDEALESGRVVREPMLDLEGQPVPGAWRYFLAPDEAMALPAPAPEQDDTDTPDAPDSFDDEGVEDVEAPSVPDPIEVQPQVETHHNTPWPNTTGLRQVTSLPGADVLVEDIRCPYWDIPTAWNINIPRPDGSPFGQGEPTRLEDVQQQINRILSVIDNHLRYYQFPMRYWPQDVLQRLQASGAQFHSRPGMEIPIPKDQWERMIAAGGFDRMTQNIPAVPAFYVQILDRLLQEHDTLSGNVGVRQGREPFSGASGELVNTLTNNAAGPLAFKSKFTEWMVERVARLALDAMVKWLPESRWARIVNRYELPVLRDIIQRVDPEVFDVRVEIASGRGANREINEQRAMTQYQSGLLSKRTTMERVGIDDPDAEERQIMSEQRNDAQTTAPVQAAVADQGDAMAQQQANGGE